MTGVKVITLIDNVPMGNGHNGLAEIAKKVAKIKVDELATGEVLMFLNRAKDKLKILGSRGVVVGYLKMPKGRRIMLEAIQYIPQTFGSNGAINYDSALTKALTERLQAVRTKHMSPLQAVRAMDRAGL